MKKKGRPKLRLTGIKLEDKKKIKKKHKTARYWRDRERLNALILAMEGQHTYEQIAQKLGKARSTIQLWIKNYREGGLPSLLARPQGTGNKARLEDKAQAKLKKQLERGSFRTAWQARAWIKSEFDVEFSLIGTYYWLKKLGGRLKVPRQSHIKKNVKAQTEFKKTFYQRLCALPISRKKGTRVKVWIQDEGRYGLHSFVRHVWGLSGVRVLAPSQMKYEWGYVYGALECVTGGAVFAYQPTVSLEAMLLYINEIVKTDPDAEHIMLYDRAGFHFKPGDPRLPKNIHIIELPPKSPELNPVEKLWDQMKDRICNRAFESLDAIEDKITPLLKKYWSEPEHCLRLIGAHKNNWLPFFSNS